MSTPSQPIRILIVDDHKSILWGLEKAIESQHPRMEVVGKACTRSEVFECVRRTSPNLILLDLDLKEENSLDFLPQLMEESTAKVLILTGERNTELHERAIRCGASGVVLKDESIEVLLKAIEKVYGGELWLDRATAGKVFNAMSRRNISTKVDGEAAKIAELTPTERRVILAVVNEAGATNRKLAVELRMSENTLRNHLSSIYDKLDVENRIGLFMYAVKHGLDKAEQ